MSSKQGDQMPSVDGPIITKHWLDVKVLAWWSGNYDAPLYQKSNCKQIEK